MIKKYQSFALWAFIVLMTLPCVLGTPSKILGQYQFDIKSEEYELWLNEDSSFSFQQIISASGSTVPIKSDFHVFRIRLPPESEFLNIRVIDLIENKELVEVPDFSRPSCNYQFQFNASENSLGLCYDNYFEISRIKIVGTILPEKNYTVCANCLMNPSNNILISTRPESYDFSLTVRGGENVIIPPAENLDCSARETLDGRTVANLQLYYTHNGFICRGKISDEYALSPIDLKIVGNNSKILEDEMEETKYQEQMEAIKIQSTSASKTMWSTIGLVIVAFVSLI